MRFLCQRHGREERCLHLSDVILFWIPRDLDTLPGFTTNIEWGVWHASGRCVLGAPPNAPKLRYLRRTNRHLLRASTFDLPIAADSIDVLVHSQVIEHIDYDPRLFSEMNRVLKLGGTLVIGTPGRRISRADALDHVAGVSIYNDGSVREFQRQTSQFTPGKNFAGTGGFGPWMMTPDEIGDLNGMEITTRLNGEVMQNATADLLVHGFAELIEYCSTFIELLPGDVIVTGTPGGVGAARNPPVFMDEGDVVEVEVKPVGVLRHRVVVG